MTTLVRVAFESLFWIAITTVVYVYVGYPVIVFLASRVRPRPVSKLAHQPTISIVIAAHNEESWIARTIENKLALDYPSRKVQIIVVSDGSTDRTDAIAAEYQSARVVFLRQEPRNGKTAALNLAVRHATGDILVFADANSLYDKSALRHLAANFADPQVGYVTGALVYTNPDGSMTGAGCSMYMKYEDFLRRCESAAGSLVGVNGGIDAVRRSLYEPMNADDLPDFVLPLRVVEKHFRVVYEPDAVLCEEAHGRVEDEYRMRVRVALRALWTLAEMRRLMNVRRFGVYAVQLVSHKALRYLAFILFLTALVTSAALSPTRVLYLCAFLGQVGVLACVWAGYVAERVGRHARVLSAPYYLFVVNAASIQAFVKFLRAERHRTWSPRLG
jgi:cellulose synthase/poly-beta-1,6-N-acetylglucosamine synthase-like glycosyltransferase